MAKGYWVAFADINDPEGYKAYIAENAKAFKKYGGRFLTRGGLYEAPEGKPRSRTVVIEFPTYSAAGRMLPLARVRQSNGAPRGEVSHGPVHCRGLRRSATIGNVNMPRD